MAEDAGAALEQFITSQFAGLSIDVPLDDVEMMARFVEEELEREDKVEGVRGMLEGVVEVSSVVTAVLILDTAARHRYVDQCYSGRA